MRLIDAEEAKKVVRELAREFRVSRNEPFAEDGDLVIEAFDAIIDAVQTLGEERAKG